MAQAQIGTVDPNTTSGTELASLLSNFNDAMRSGHAGATRPSYIQRGGLWVQDTGGANLLLYLFDGTDDILLGTFNATANTFTASGSASVTLAGLGGVATSRTITGGTSLSGGGDLTTNRTLTLLNDSVSPGNSRYYGTNSGGSKGFFPLPSFTQSNNPLLAVYSAGAGQTFTFPATCTRVMFMAAGGGGGTRYRLSGQTFYGGGGALAMGSINRIGGTVLTLNVGGAGSDLTTGGEPGESALDYDFSGNGGNTDIVGVITCGGGLGINLVGSGGSVGSYSNIEVGLNYAQGMMPFRAASPGGANFFPRHYGDSGMPGIVIFWSWNP